MSGATTLILASLKPEISEITVRSVWGTCVETYISSRPVDGSNSPRAPWPSIGRPVMRWCENRSRSTPSAEAKAASVSPWLPGMYMNRLSPQSS